MGTPIRTTHPFMVLAVIALLCSPFPAMAKSGNGVAYSIEAKLPATAFLRMQLAPAQQSLRTFAVPTLPASTEASLILYAIWGMMLGTFYVFARFVRWRYGAYLARLSQLYGWRTSAPALATSGAEAPIRTAISTAADLVGVN